MPTGETSNAPDPFEGGGRVRVLLPLPLAGAYDYRVGPRLSLQPGDFVRVPLGRRQVIGVVWGESYGEGVAETKLKTVTARCDVPRLSDEMRRFIDWVSDYTLSPPGAVLRMSMSVPEALEPPKPLIGYQVSEAAPHPDTTDPGEVRLTTARRRVLRELGSGPPRGLAELALAAGVGTGVVRSLIELGWLEAVDLPRARPSGPDGTKAGPSLSPEQERAAEKLRAQLSQGFSVTLVDGVTGSGKTEVYFEAIAAALREGRQSLVLLPEIALSAQWLARFEARFGASPVIWHSEISPAQRRRTWREVAEGSVPVVVGARSALFLPFARLGLVVVDEEHEAAFKQEDGVVYHARDMAVVRARFAEVPALLVSATPALETVINVERGRYGAVHLPDRHGGASLPAIQTIDMRREKLPRNSFLSPTLREAIAETLGRDEQAMLFLNRRGYAPLTLCRTCGYRLSCPTCTSWLVEHRRAGRLQCHHCGYTAAKPPSCPSCNDDDSFVPCGPGVERVAEEAGALFPGAQVALVTSDTMTGPRAAAEFLEKMAGHGIDLLIGTQIVAKGHHFPRLTLVGVIDADLGLGGGDLRAAERTYQLLHQVAGRAGRAEKPGRALLQTYMPEHPVMQALVALSQEKGARDRFLAVEAEERRRYGWPPFGRLAAVIVAGRDADEVDRVARDLGRTAPSGNGIETLGPAPAPLALLRGRHRRRLLVKASRETNLQAALDSWLRGIRVPSNVRLQVDIDPYSFL